MKKIIILLLTINSVLLSQKLTVTDYYPSSDGFITSWLLRGMFLIDDTRSRDFDFLSEYGGEKKIWIAEKMIKDNQIGNRENFSSKWLPVNPVSYSISPQDFYGKSPFKACYGLAFVESASNQPVLIKCGSDDGIKIILNGKTIHDNNVWRGVTVDEDIVKSELRKGMNSLLVKVNNGTGGFGFCIRITTPANTTLENIKLKLPNSFSFDEIFKSIYSSFNIYTTYDKTDGSPKFLTRITSESCIPVDFMGGLILKLSLTENSGKVIEEFYSEKLDNIGNFKTKELICKPNNLTTGRYVIKLKIMDPTGNILTEKDDIVFWN